MKNSQVAGSAFLPIGIVFIIIGMGGKTTMLIIGIMFLFLSIGAFAKSKKDSGDEKNPLIED
jgi:hypothetical protein